MNRPLEQYAALELYVLLDAFAESLDLDCLIAPADVAFAQRRSVEPDLFVVPRANGRRARHFDEVRQLVLAVEVISRSTARADRYKKRHLYQSEGVPEYWIVDPNARFVERWRPGDDEPEILIDSLAWAPRDDAEPLVIDLAAYFRRVHGESTVRRGSTSLPSPTPHPASSPAPRDRTRIAARS